MAVPQNDALDNLGVTRLAHHALERYPVSLQGDLQLLCRSENATFRLIAGGKRYALRIHRENYHDKAAIESELLWLDALRQDTGIVVPEAIPDRSGERVLTVGDGTGAQRHAALFHWIEGDAPTNSVDPAAFRQLGEIAARLHKHSKSWQRPAGFRRILWSHETMVGSDGHWGYWAHVPGLRTQDVEVIKAAQSQVAGVLASFGKAPERFGLIHADLRLTNLLMHWGETRIIDFDDCGMGWYLHDLAAAVSFEEHHPGAPRWVENWLQGYESVSHLDDDSLAVLPSMLIQRRIQLTAWMATHSETDTAKGLANRWVGDTVRLSGLYLEGKTLPLG